MTILEVDSVIKRYGTETVALDNVSFSVQPGEFVAIIGPSGAGKSTLLRCINRLIDVTSGDIRFAGVSVPQLRGAALRRHRTQIGMIFQHYNLVNRLSVIENVLHGRLGYKNTLQGILGLYSEQEKRDAVRILETLGLTEQMYKRCDQLSGGQKQRVGIARALVQKPKMLLCDEPIASLDPSSAKVIMDTLQDINRTMGITVLVNLHQVDVALHYAERIIGVNKGRIIYDGAPHALSNAQIYQIYGSEAGELILDLKERYAA
ncbi:phosphonate ABC transporter ATP-binding protein [Chloroflexus sp.]|uniref:phosphonate ABC transporter ATP-binding protein n=1 Tax=Chloroflexus sp. TaxID=1904827 RepID=UPI002617D1B7|nr:phosphonate ABC transporter ATP-binding protein [uncultured Chloroflexus sp.]